MQASTFYNSIANGQIDILQLLLELLGETGSDYCVIGGLAVNAYAEPVVSLDINIIAAVENLDKICDLAISKGLLVEKFEHSVNLRSDKSDLRIQFQTDSRYQSFIVRSVEKEILGRRIKTASIEDVLQGKIWAYSDMTRRKSKRQKDLADILRLVETNPQLQRKLPTEILKLLE